MEKVTGIKSVDFKIIAKGHGVVNWNGPTNLTGEDGKTVDNHSMPKLRGYTNLSGKVKDTGYKYRKEPQDIDFSKTPLYISQNCIRHHLFREQAFDMHYASSKNLAKVLASETGLLRGYVVPSSQSKRTSPLLLEDFVDQLGNGNFEQFGQAGERDSSSFYSKTTFGDTEYISYGSISIEQLQFISLDRKFDRGAMDINDGQGQEIAQQIKEYLKDIGGTDDVQAAYHLNYVRRGTIFEEGEQGILLNEAAQKVLVQHMIDKIESLVIRQAKSYMYVDSVEVDYNDSNKMMRIKRDESECATQPEDKFAVYFDAK
jgi:uncharacterized protein YqkB